MGPELRFRGKPVLPVDKSRAPAGLQEAVAAWVSEKVLPPPRPRCPAQPTSRSVLIRIPPHLQVACRREGSEHSPSAGPDTP